MMNNFFKIAAVACLAVVTASCWPFGGSSAADTAKDCFKKVTDAKDEATALTDAKDMATPECIKACFALKGKSWDKAEVTGTVYSVKATIGGADKMFVVTEGTKDGKTTTVVSGGM